MPRSTVSATTIIGTPVMNWQGQHLGTISDFVVNKFGGEIEYLVIAPGNSFDKFISSLRYAVPFMAVARHRREDGTFDYILDLTPEALVECPHFDASMPPDFSSEDFRASLQPTYSHASLDIQV